MRCDGKAESSVPRLDSLLIRTNRADWRRPLVLQRVGSTERRGLKRLTGKRDNLPRSVHGEDREQPPHNFSARDQVRTGARLSALNIEK
jgi:hypothetical protein